MAGAGGPGRGPRAHARVAAIRRKTSKPKPFLTGYAAPVVAVGAHAGRVYTGDLTGAIYRVKP